MTDSNGIFRLDIVILISNIDFIGKELSVDKLLVNTVKGKQRCMGTSLLDLSVLHHNDFIRVTYRAQSVSDHNNSLLTRSDQLVQCLLNLVLALSVQG